MKKMIALLLTALMGLALTACGGDGGSKDTGLPGVDMKSTEVQAVTSDRAELAVLNETFATYLGGLNYFTIDEPQSKMTYADLKAHGIYTWYAAEDEACALNLFFGDDGKLVAAGAYNLDV